MLRLETAKLKYQNSQLLEQIDGTIGKNEELEKAKKKNIRCISKKTSAKPSSFSTSELTYKSESTNSMDFYLQPWMVEEYRRLIYRTQSLSSEEEVKVLAVAPPVYQPPSLRPEGLWLQAVGAWSLWVQRRRVGSALVREWRSCRQPTLERPPQEQLAESKGLSSQTSFSPPVQKGNSGSTDWLTVGQIGVLN